MQTSTLENQESIVKVPNLAQTLLDLFPTHPFTVVHEKKSMKTLLQNYLAMSMSFPYLQSASCAENILECLKSGDEVPEYVEKTMIIGSFLVWDELGGWHNTYKKGHAGLPNLLNTKHVHANLLKKDLESIFGEKIHARFDEVTKDYLLNFYRDLSSSNAATKCAAMVSFELHAERMIKSLWQSVAKSFDVQKDALKYFSAHVGGDDPAEAYHVQMTQNLVDALITKDIQHTFMAEAVRIYFTHFQWCEAISQPSIEEEKFNVQ